MSLFVARVNKNDDIINSFVETFNEKSALLINQRGEYIGEYVFFDIKTSLPPIWIIGLLLCGLWAWLGWWWGLLISAIFFLPLLFNSARFQFWVMRKGLQKKGYTGMVKFVSVSDGLRWYLWGKI